MQSGKLPWYPVFMAEPAPAPRMAQGLHLEALALVVEGAADARIVEGVLAAAGFPVERVHIVVGLGRYGAARMAEEIAQGAQEHCAVLVDLDERSVPDAQARAREQLGAPPFDIFCAVPSIEAWLFADHEAAQAYASPDEDVQRIVRRLPLPEEIPDPKQLARYVFGPSSKWGFIHQIDIGRAAARSPSLRIFLEGMGRLLGVPTPPLMEGVARHFSRDIIAGLVREVPADTVVWRTLSGDEYTADELRRLIEEGDEVGRQYASDLLRISRDFLLRKANRPTSQ